MMAVSGQQNDKDKSDEGEEQTKLKRELTLIDGASMIIGIIVGSGIFVSPKGVLQYAGSVGLSCLVWLLSGLLSFIGALCYAELGTMIPKSGGDYAYIKYAYGPLLSFLYLWSALLVIMPAGNAIIALTFASYILEPFYPECEPPLDAVRLIAAMLICKILQKYYFLDNIYILSSRSVDSSQLLQCQTCCKSDGSCICNKGKSLQRIKVISKYFLCVRCWPL